MIPLGSNIADIGTDHAYLPLVLMKEGKIKKAIASDINKGPYLSALETIKNSDLSPDLKDNISIRHGNGLEVLTAKEAAILIIAGMGGITIIDILKQNPTLTNSFDKLILQPMNAADKVRQYLHINQWKIIDEDLVLKKNSDNIIYTIISFEKSNTPLPEIEPILFGLGPLLFERKHPLLKLFIEEKIKIFQKTATAIQNSTSADNSAKYKEILKRIKLLEDKYSCL